MDTTTRDCGKVLGFGRPAGGLTVANSWCARRSGHAGECDATGLVDLAEAEARIAGPVLPIGSTIKIEGRTYSVDRDLGVGDQLRAQLGIVGQFEISGPRRGLGLLQVFQDGRFRALFGHSFTRSIEGSL